MVILRPRDDFYETRNPGPADILLVIEVADSSIEYDREVKARLYARSGVPEHWLIDVNENVLSGSASLERGVYGRLRTYRPRQSVTPELLPERVVSVDDLLGS